MFTYLQLGAVTIIKGQFYKYFSHQSLNKLENYLLPRLGGAFDLRLAVSVPLPIVMGIFVLLWFQSRLT